MDKQSAQLAPQSAAQLAGTLAAYCVPYLGGEVQPPGRDVAPAELLAGLARQREARLRMAIIPLLLVRPEIAPAAREAAATLDEEACGHLRLYYSAAYVLHGELCAEFAARLGPQSRLPPLFHAELGLLETLSSEQALAWLGAAHRRLTGWPANWAGSYRHAAARILARLDAERRWQLARR